MGCSASVSATPVQTIERKNVHGEYDIEVCIRVLNAKQIPGNIDSYILMRSENTGNKSKHTKTISDNPNPAWNQPLAARIPLEKAIMWESDEVVNNISFELWDKNSVASDKLIGFGTFELKAPHLRNSQVVHTLQLKKKDKDEQVGVLEFAIESYRNTCRSVYNALTKIYGDKTRYDSDGEGRVYFPLPGTNDAVYVGLEFEKADCLDLKLYTVQSPDHIYLDILWQLKSNTQVRRRNVTSPVKIIGDLKYYEELKVDDVPTISIVSGNLNVLLFNKKQIGKIDLGQVVREHGWEGSLTYDQAAATLKNVEIDTAEREIFMRRDFSLIAIDYDAGNVDMKCFVMDTPENQYLAYDLQLIGDDVKKTTEIISPPKLLLGKYYVTRKLELDDVPYGTAFADMVWRKYQIGLIRQINLVELVQLIPN